MYESQQDANMLIYKNFVKYNALDDIFKKEFTGSKERVVNVYIDLFTLLSDLYRSVNVKNVMSITSSIINMGIHYRRYFGKKGIYTNIIFVYSPNMSQNNIKYINTWYIGYREKINNNPNSLSIINKNLELVSTVVHYIPDMFLKTGTVSPTVIVFDIIRTFINKGFDHPNVFITRDPYAFQLPSILPNTILIFKKYKQGGEDVSFSVNYNNCFNEFLKITKNLYIEEQVSPDWLFPYFVLSGLGRAKYGIPALLNFNKSLSALCDLASKHSSFDIDSIYNAAIEFSSKKAIITRKDIEDRYKCLNIYHQLAEYSVLPEAQEFNWLAQAKDMDNLHNINNRYFKDNPMNLDWLM